MTNDVESSKLGMKIGDPVEVHTRYSDSWVRGFEIAELVPEGYRVRRTSDGALLPGFTSELDLRAPVPRGWKVHPDRSR